MTIRAQLNNAQKREAAKSTPQASQASTSQPNVNGASGSPAPAQSPSQSTPRPEGQTPSESQPQGDAAAANAGMSQWSQVNFQGKVSHKQQTRRLPANLLNSHASLGNTLKKSSGHLGLRILCWLYRWKVSWIRSTRDSNVPGMKIPIGSSLLFSMTASRYTPF
jgi:hypothetical protein